MHDLIFPQLARRRWVKINLDRCAQWHLRRDKYEPINRLLDPDYCDSWVRRVTQINGGDDLSYGGYLEDRAYMWAGSYLKPESSIHLGVDFNVPSETKVYAARTGRVVDVIHDPDQEGGWGGRIIIKLTGQDLHYLYAHMDDILPKVGDEITQGELVGIVATSDKNGGWYPHLHVQCVSGDIPADLDGYGIHDPDKYPSPFLLGA